MLKKPKSARQWRYLHPRSTSAQFELRLRRISGRAGEIEELVKLVRCSQLGCKAHLPIKQGPQWWKLEET